VTWVQQGMAERAYRAVQRGGAIELAAKKRPRRIPRVHRCKTAGCHADRKLIAAFPASRGGCHDNEVLTPRASGKFSRFRQRPLHWSTRLFSVAIYAVISSQQGMKQSLKYCETRNSTPDAVTHLRQSRFMPFRLNVINDRTLAFIILVFATRITLSLIAQG